MAMDAIIETAIKLILAKLPPETTEKIAQLGQIGIGLDAKLDAILAGLNDIKQLLAYQAQNANQEQQDHGGHSGPTEHRTIERTNGARIDLG